MLNTNWRSREPKIASLTLVDNRFTDLEVARDGVAAASRPHDLDEFGVAGRDLAVHSERVVAVQLFPPLVCHEVFSQGAHVAQALGMKGLTGTGEQRVNRQW